jgi:phosphate-transporting ATPase
MLRIRGLARAGLGPIDLDLEAGACTALAGPSGAGKSLLLRAIADLDPNDGEVSLDGTGRDSMPAPEWRRQVGYLAAESGWWEDTVGLHFSDPGGSAPLLARLGLGPGALDWPVERLSTGEKQRLALARLLENDPRVLLLDEPTAALDPDSRTAVEGIIGERLAGGAAVLIVTHDEAQAERLAARRLTMTGGLIGEVGP